VFLRCPGAGSASADQHGQHGSTGSTGSTSSTGSTGSPRTADDVPPAPGGLERAVRERIRPISSWRCRSRRPGSYCPAHRPGSTTWQSTGVLRRTPLRRRCRRGRTPRGHRATAGRRRRCTGAPTTVGPDALGVAARHVTLGPPLRGPAVRVVGHHRTTVVGGACGWSRSSASSGSPPGRRTPSCRLAFVPDNPS